MVETLLLKKKQKENSPNLVEMSCTCGERHTPLVAAQIDTNAQEQLSVSSPSVERNWKRTSAFKTFQKISFAMVGVFVLVLLGRNVVNNWLNSPQLEIHRTKERLAWISKVEKMSLLEAKLLETQLVLRTCRRQPHLISNGSNGDVFGSMYVSRGESFGGDVFGEDSAPELSQGGENEARLALFYAARKQNIQAIGALEQSLHLKDPKLFNPAWEPWRWEMLRDFYIQQGDDLKAAALVEKISHRGYYVRAPEGDDLRFHEVAKHLFSKVGWKDKADREEKLAQRASLMPKRFSLDSTSKRAFLELRDSKFKYANIALAEDHPQDAINALTELVTDKEALRARSDRAEFLAVANMMIPIAQVSAGDWEAASKSFPKALRLAAAEVALNYDCQDAKPALYDAYAKFLQHQGKSVEAARYRQLSDDAQRAKRPTPTYGKDGRPINMSVLKYDQNDLYPPELLK